jgi:hypothetical protein
MSTKYTGPLTRKRLADFESETSPSGAVSTTTVKRKGLRDKVKLLVHELKTNSVDSPHHWGWLHLRVTNLSTEECEAIAEGLKVNTDNVVWLDISPINISFEGLACIIDSLKTNTLMSQLYLHGKPKNDLYDEEDGDDYLIPVPVQSYCSKF